jgi:hypothetical protein
MHQIGIRRREFNFKSLALHAKHTNVACRLPVQEGNCHKG